MGRINRDNDREKCRGSSRHRGSCTCAALAGAMAVAYVTWEDPVARSFRGARDNFIGLTIFFLLRKSAAERPVVSKLCVLYAP